MRKIDEFRMEMENPKRAYGEELKNYIRKYDFIGNATLIEDPDMDTVDYIYYLSKLTRVDEATLHSSLNDINDHMLNFSIANGMDEFSEHAFIFYARAREPSMLEQFRLIMEGPKKTYTEELKRFAKKYDFLGEMTLVEEPDIDTLDYIYYFSGLNGADEEILKSACDEMYEHMLKFSKINGIDEFSENAHIFHKR